MHELIPLIEQASAEMPAIPAYRAMLAHAHARAGHMDQARELIRADLSGGFAMPDDMAWSIGIANWVDAAVLVREPEAAATLRELFVPYHDQLVTTEITFEPAFCHYLGRLDHVLGRYDDAERWFTEAMALHEQLGSPQLVAQTQAAWALMLADRERGDDHTRARDMATNALDAAVAGGYGYIEADARAPCSRDRSDDARTAS